MVGIKQSHLSVCHEWIETVVVGFCMHHKTRKIRDIIFSHTTLRVLSKLTYLIPFLPNALSIVKKIIQTHRNLKISFSKDLMMNNGLLSNAMINPDLTMTPFDGIKIFGLLL